MKNGRPVKGTAIWESVEPFDGAGGGGAGCDEVLAGGEVGEVQGLCALGGEAGYECAGEGVDVYCVCSGGNVEGVVGVDVKVGGSVGGNVVDSGRG